MMINDSHGLDDTSIIIVFVYICIIGFKFRTEEQRGEEFCYNICLPGRCLEKDGHLFQSLLDMPHCVYEYDT